MNGRHEHGFRRKGTLTAPDWEFKITAFKHYTRVPVSLLEQETGIINESFFRNQFEYAEAVEWIFGKILKHGLLFRADDFFSCNTSG